MLQLVISHGHTLEGILAYFFVNKVKGLVSENRLRKKGDPWSVLNQRVSFCLITIFVFVLCSWVICAASDSCRSITDHRDLY